LHLKNAHLPQGRFAVAKALPIMEVGTGRKKRKRKKKGKKQPILFLELWVEESVSQSLRHEPLGRAVGKGRHQT